MDDKVISEMTLTNIAEASRLNFCMTDVLDAQQMRLLAAYKDTYNYEPHVTFFLSLGLMSHFAQNSYFTHYANADRCPVQLYLWLLGPSGEFLHLNKAKNTQ
jgi:hypothetical protein